MISATPFRAGELILQRARSEGYWRPHWTGFSQLSTKSCNWLCGRTLQLYRLVFKPQTEAAVYVFLLWHCGLLSFYHWAAAQPGLGFCRTVCHHLPAGQGSNPSCQTVHAFEQGKEWMKKVTGLFNVTMGCFDSAEVCQLVGTFVLATLSKKIPSSDIGLYRGDGLGALWNMPGSQADRIRKDVMRIFEELGLRITIQINLKVADFLDVTLNLNSESY